MTSAAAPLATSSPQQCFVSGIPFTVSKTEFEDFIREKVAPLDKAGVEDVTLLMQGPGRNKGFGFVRFASLELAERAIHESQARRWTLGGSIVSLRLSTSSRQQNQQPSVHRGDQLRRPGATREIHAGGTIRQAYPLADPRGGSSQGQGTATPSQWVPAVKVFLPRSLSWMNASNVWWSSVLRSKEFHQLVDHQPSWHRFFKHAFDESNCFFVEVNTNFLTDFSAQTNGGSGSLIEVVESWLSSIGCRRVAGPPPIKRLLEDTLDSGNPDTNATLVEQSSEFAEWLAKEVNQAEGRFRAVEDHEGTVVFVRVRY
jgi:hypothetical protein